MTARVLLVEADSRESEALQITLAEWGYEVICASDADSAPAKCGGGSVDVVLFGTEDAARTQSQARLRRTLPEATWIEILAPDAAESGIDSQASDILYRPVTPQTLSLALRRANRHRELENQTRILRAEIDAAFGDRPIVAASQNMIRVLEDTERAAASTASVLLVGERGTGREGIARAIHGQGPKRRGPFVSVRAGSGLSGERALFGTVESEAPIRRGPVPAADGGTLFIERVDALDLGAQARLLELIHTGSLRAVGAEKPLYVDVRVIASATHSLEAAVTGGSFDGGLCKQLDSIRIAVPSLRERREDIPLLVDHFFARAAQESNPPLRGLTDDALARLSAYDWPGNVRELQNVIERAVLLASDEMLTLDDLSADLEGRDEPDSATRLDLGLRRARRRAEIEIIRRALRQTGGNRTHAARLLEISHRALLYKLKEYALKD